MQSLTLKVERELSGDVLREISQRINPAYLKEQLKSRGVPDMPCEGCGTTVYECADAFKTIPTEDLTLQRQGNGFYGSASGCSMRSKLLVKTVAIKEIQNILQRNGIKSEISFEDVAREEYEMLSKYGLAPKRRAPAWLA